MKITITLSSIRAAHAAGMSDRQMAEHFRVSLGYMRQTRSGYGLKPNKEKQNA